MGLKNSSYPKLLPSVFSRKSAEAMMAGFYMNLGGNISGDGFHNGGCLVIGAGGRDTLYTFKQEDAANHPDNYEY